MRRLPAQPRAEAYDEGRLLALSEAIRWVDRRLVQRVGDARLLKGETLADLAKSGTASSALRHSASWQMQIAPQPENVEDTSASQIRALLL